MSKNNLRKQIAIIHDDLHPLLEKIQERLAALGAEPLMLSWRQMSFGTGLPNVLSDYSALYLDRMGERTSSYTTQMALLEELTELPIVNQARPYAIARNKALTARQLQKVGLPIPPTAIIYDQQQFKAFRKANQSDFYIGKPIFGCCARDVVIIKTEESDEGLVRLWHRDGMAVVQTFIRNPERFIWRVDIVNNEVIVVNQRFAYNADRETPICNGTQGGQIKFWHPSEMPEDVRKLALSAVSALELTVAGVDLLPDENGNLYVLEVNPEPDITMDRFEFPYAIANYLWSLT